MFTAYPFGSGSRTSKSVGSYLAKRGSAIWKRGKASIKRTGRSPTETKLVQMLLGRLAQITKRPKLENLDPRR